jgi:aryl-phospho-beta-D-glucosidase BglC (GH1 family)
MQKIIFLFLSALFFMVSCSLEKDASGGGNPGEKTGPYPGTAMEFVTSMKIGWNLGNTFDGHSGLNPGETIWQNTRTTQTLINGVAARGFGAVRIPVTWGQKLHRSLRHNPGQINLSIAQIEALTIDPAWIARVSQVVEFVRAAGMVAIINIHHDGADSYHWLSVKNEDLTGENKEKVDAIFRTLWRQIAEYFKDAGYYLVFEGFNELHDGSWGNGNPAQRRRINELNQIFVDTVREVGGENEHRFLLIHGWVTRPSITVSDLVMPKDSIEDRLIVGIHFYDPYDFSGSARWNTWGDKVNTGNRAWANEGNVIRQFDRVKERFIDENIPVILGEYGAVRQSGDGHAYRKYYMEYVTKAAVDRKIIPFYWDNAGFNNGSEGFGLLRRTNGTAFDNASREVLEVMMRAAYEDYDISEIVAP